MIECIGVYKTLNKSKLTKGTVVHNNNSNHHLIHWNDRIEVLHNVFFFLLFMSISILTNISIAFDHVFEFQIQALFFFVLRTKQVSSLSKHWNIRCWMEWNGIAKLLNVLVFPLMTKSKVLNQTDRHSNNRIRFIELLSHLIEKKQW